MDKPLPTPAQVKAYLKALTALSNIFGIRVDAGAVLITHRPAGKPSEVVGTLVYDSIEKGTYRVAGGS